MPQEPGATIRVDGDLYRDLRAIAQARDCTLRQAMDFWYDIRLAADVARHKAKVDKEVKGAVAKQLEAVHDAGAKAKAKPKPKAEPKPVAKPWPWLKVKGSKVVKCGKCGAKFGEGAPVLSEHEKVCKS